MSKIMALRQFLLMAMMWLKTPAIALLAVGYIATHKELQGFLNWSKLLLLSNI